MERIEKEGGTETPVAQAPRKPVLTVAAGKAVLLGIGIALVLAVGGYFGFQSLRAGLTTRTVPADLVGQPVEAARARVNQFRLRPVVVYDAASTGKSGLVVKVKPPEGTKVRINGDVTLVVAGKGPRPTPIIPPALVKEQHSGSNTTPPAVASKVQVPDVVEMSEAKARQKLSALGLEVEMKAGEPAAHAGIVQAMKPKAESLVDKGAVVVLTVSTAQAPTAAVTPASTLITVKDYAGTLGTDAVKDLRRSGLAATWSYETTKIQPAGYVVRTNPPAGSQLPYGSQVTVVLAKQ
ncbi:MAG: Serine/threonine-protein kinase PK-1 [bacterium ADurb.Bin429]|nr:MAG: Serine/threonine-protein kinase PK-1 [bacterium ADurb.Bin429]